MLFRSTNFQSPLANFREATIKGQPPDKGLYFPEAIPTFPSGMFGLSKEEMAFEIIKPYVGDTIPEDVLRKIVADTINFDIPLLQLSEDIYTLELFHGPTLAFKDVGARFMSRCLEYFVRNNDRKVIVLTATSGDTGGAVAHGFYQMEGIDVVILYPSGKVSEVQELQLTTLGHNIHALEIEGTFDDCQRLVKQAFADEELNNQLMLTSANSINVARWLPQQFYYCFAWQQWPHKGQPPVISVPSGNFGNLCAGVLAALSGLSVKHFIAACNANDVAPQYFSTAEYHPKPSVQTLSNAMDVGDPSNFVRLLQLFGSNFNQLAAIISSDSISDEETVAAIKDVYNQYNYVMDPHGAVAYASLKKYLQEHQGQKGIFLETAHPVKFEEVVQNVVDVPDPVKNLLRKKKQSTRLDNQYNTLKDYLSVHY